MSTPAKSSAKKPTPRRPGYPIGSHLRALRGRVTGLAWPTYVLDIPGGHGKVPIGPDYRRGDDLVADTNGRMHRA